MIPKQFYLTLASLFLTRSSFQSTHHSSLLNCSVAHTNQPFSSCVLLLPTLTIESQADGTNPCWTETDPLQLCVLLLQSSILRTGSWLLKPAKPQLDCKPYALHCYFVYLCSGSLPLNLYGALLFRLSFLCCFNLLAYSSAMFPTLHVI